jgi:hypothetical protein
MFTNKNNEKSNLASSVTSSRGETSAGEDSLQGSRFVGPMELDFEDAFVSGNEIDGQSGAEDMLDDTSNDPDRKGLNNVPDMEELDDLDNAERLVSDKGQCIQRRRRRRMYRDDKGESYYLLHSRWM